MIAVFLVQMVISIVCSITGLLFYSFIKADLRSKHLLVFPVTGLALLAMLTQLISLAFPINHIVFLVLVTILLVLFMMRFRQLLPLLRTAVNNFQLHYSYILFFIALWLMILVFNAGPTMMDDTESYHIQMIKWIRQFGTVPGLANLHERFGFHSSWFAAAGFFYLPITTGNFYTVLNGTLSVWLCLHLILLLGAEDKRNRKLFLPLLAVLLLTIACWPMTRGNAATANYDFITTVITVILFTSLFKKTSNNWKEEWLIWPVFLVTVRIINYPLLILTFIGLLEMFRAGQWKNLAMYKLLFILFIVPFLTRNVMLSGYPFYPSPVFNFFSVDWKVRPEVITYLLDYIKYFNRVNPMFLPLDETRQLGTPEWIVTWFRFQFRYDKLVLIPGLIGLACGILVAFRSKTSIPRLQLLVAVLIIQVISWFFVAPDPRFIYGPLLCGAFLLVYMFPYFKLKERLTNGMVILLSIFTFLYAIHKIIFVPPYSNIVSPRELPRPEVKIQQVKEMKVYLPTAVMYNWNSRCYDTKLPCAYVIDSGLVPRGNSLREGFRIEK